MPGISNGKNKLEWLCRILMTIDVFVILTGYFSLFQAQRQLNTPLIPQSTVCQILLDSGNLAMKASLISSGLFLTGLWFYSFKKKIPAIVLFGLAAISFKITVMIL